MTDHPQELLAPFDKRFFEEDLTRIVGDYLKDYPCGFVSVRVSTGDAEYPIREVKEITAKWVSLYYHCQDKSVECTDPSGVIKKGYLAEPMIILPYECILRVEIVPAPEKKPFGFRVD